MLELNFFSSNEWISRKVISMAYKISLESQLISTNKLSSGDAHITQTGHHK